MSKMFWTEALRLEPPPKTEAPSVKELDDAMAGSLKCLVRNVLW
jgi:hypothetical protein